LAFGSTLGLGFSATGADGSSSPNRSTSFSSFFSSTLGLVAAAFSTQLFKRKGEKLET